MYFVFSKFSDNTICI